MHIRWSRIQVRKLHPEVSDLPDVGIYKEVGNVLREYVALLILVGVVVASAICILVMSRFMAPRRPTRVKGEPYESGISPLGSVRDRFSIKFYLVAILFLVFDIEAVFMIPWAVGFRQLGLLGLIEMLIFVLILCVAFCYVWMRGALDWE